MSDFAFNDAPSYNVTLSKREAALLSRWERERRSAVTIGDIRALVGERAALDVARELVRKGVLQRVRRGVYLVRPLRTLGRPSASSSVISAEALLRDEPHYFGGLWAVSLHGLSEQRYESILDAFLTHRLASRTLGAARVRFHVLPSESFDYGITKVTTEGVAVSVSDVERTLLDALDHPRVFFGVSRAVQLLKANLDKVDQKSLLSYAATGSRPSTCQRLGVLLERRGASQRSMARLRRKARETGSLLSLDPDAPRTGKVNATWSVVENDA